MSSIDAQDSRSTAADTVAGLMAAASIVLSCIGMGFGLILEVDARPARTEAIAIILALVAARMSRKLPVARLEGDALRDGRVGGRDDGCRDHREPSHLRLRHPPQRVVQHVRWLPRTRMD